MSIIICGLVALVILIGLLAFTYKAGKDVRYMPSGRLITEGEIKRGIKTAKCKCGQNWFWDWEQNGNSWSPECLNCKDRKNCLKGN